MTERKSGFLTETNILCVIPSASSVVRPVRIERTTHSLEGCCSIQLSYGRPCFINDLNSYLLGVVSSSVLLRVLHLRSRVRYSQIRVELLSSFGQVLFLYCVVPLPHLL